MKKYLKNLLIALLGRNPYLLELEQTREEYRLTASRVKQMEKADAEYGDLHAADKKRIAGYQNLTESLRKRIVEKDDQLRQQSRIYNEELAKMRDFYSKGVSDRDGEIAGLRKDLDETLDRLQKANYTLAQDSIAQQTLDKTVSAMDDIYAAMQGSDMDKIIAMTENLDWCVPLLRIANRYLATLKRKNELEETVRLMSSAAAITNSRRDDNFNFD